MSIDIYFASVHFLYQISIFQSSFLVLRLLLFICKRTSVLGVCYLFMKDCGPSLPVYTQRLLPLLPVLFITDHGPCLSLFTCKGLLSLSFAIHLQRTVVLVKWYSFAKDCGPCPVVFICKGLRPCLVSLVCKGTAVLLFHLLSQQN